MAHREDLRDEHLPLQPIHQRTDTGRMVGGVDGLVFRLSARNIRDSHAAVWETDPFDRARQDTNERMPDMEQRKLDAGGSPVDRQHGGIRAGIGIDRLVIVRQPTRVSLVTVIGRIH